MTEKEKILIAGCVKGDKTSWNEFVQQYSNLVYHTIRKTLTLHHADSRDQVVEDLYQEVFLSLLKDDSKKLRQFRGDRGCSLASWLSTLSHKFDDVFAHAALASICSCAWIFERSTWRS